MSWTVASGWRRRTITSPSSIRPTTTPRSTSRRTRWPPSVESYCDQVVASDPDGDALSYDLPCIRWAWSSIPIRASSGWKPTADQFGHNNVLVRVRDAYGGVVLKSYQVTVSRPDSPPVIISQPSGPAVVDPTGTQQYEYDYQVRVLDPDGDAPQYSISPLDPRRPIARRLANRSRTPDSLPGSIRTRGFRSGAGSGERIGSVRQRFGQRGSFRQSTS